MKKRIIWVVIGVLAGIAGIFGGISQQHKSDSTVYCGSKMMLPGDTCRETKNGSTKERTYEEQRAANKGEGNLIILGGGVIILISLGSLVVGLVRRKRTLTATGQAHPGQPQAGQAHADQVHAGWPPAAQTQAAQTSAGQVHTGETPAAQPQIAQTSAGQAHAGQWPPQPPAPQQPFPQRSGQQYPQNWSGTPQTPGPAPAPPQPAPWSGGQQPPGRW